MEGEVSLRYNQGKPQWSLVDFKSLEPLVRVMEYGCIKYERENWKKGLDLNQILESLSRHLFALMAGEERDPESRELHIGHIMANSMFWQYHNEKNKKVDGYTIEIPYSLQRDYSKIGELIFNNEEDKTKEREERSETSI